MKNRLSQGFSERWAKRKRGEKTYSLRGTLIAGIIASTLILWGISFAITTYVSWNQTKEVLDEALVRSAQVLSQLVDRGAVPARDRGMHGRVDLEDDRFYFQVISDGKVIARSSRAPNQPFVSEFKGHKGFAEITVNKDPWRVFVLQRRHSTYQIQVGHAVEMRREFLEDLTEELIFAGLIILGISILFNAFLVFFGLKPLTAISQQLLKLSPKNLTPIAVKTRGKEIIAIEESLNMLLANLEIARRHERQFTADASHELRTPLSAIQMKLQLLKREEPALATSLEPLQQDVKRATHLIEHLMVLARLDPMSMTTSDELEMQSIAVDTLFTEVVASFNTEIAHKNMQIDYRMSELSVYGNHDLLGVALKNIIGNALKYSPNGSVIHLSAQLRDTQVALTIQDNGPGVAPEALARLTQRFYRVLGTKETGSGLGLSIVKKIVELHQGTLNLRSTPEVAGLEVEITLPKGQDKRQI